MAEHPHFSGGNAAEWTATAEAAKRRALRWAALAGGLCAALPAAWLWGFTVDDALVSARVASHIAAGIGYRFNADGPVTDAVTPLGWAWLLAPFAERGPLRALDAARVIGALAWIVAAAWLAVQMARVGTRLVRFAPLVLLAVCVPLGAWAVSGMETGLVTALATFALSRSKLGALAAGLAAGLRPELLPWAAVLSAASALSSGKKPLAALLSVALAVAPSALTITVRLWMFGHSFPLAVLAKPSDLGFGARYLLEAVLLSGPLLLLIAARSLKSLDRHMLGVLAAVVVHLVSVLLAGGDWMPVFRLVVPVLPGALLVAAAIAEHASLTATALRLEAALIVSAILALERGVPGRKVLENRLAVVEAARAPLAGARRVATLDVGWVGAATESSLVDLAGITDPTIAVLPGPHHAKRIPPGLLEARGTDALVLLLAEGEPLVPWWTSRFDRPVERRVAQLLQEQPFVPKAVIPLGGTLKSYIVLRIKDTP